MKRTLLLIYGSISYAIFFSVFLYNVAFLANEIVPKTIDSGTPGSFGEALLVNLALLAAFAVQHSGMARPAFKRWFSPSLSYLTVFSTAPTDSNSASTIEIFIDDPGSSLRW